MKGIDIMRLSVSRMATVHLFLIRLERIRFPFCTLGPHLSHSIHIIKFGLERGNTLTPELSSLEMVHVRRC